MFALSLTLLRITYNSFPAPYLCIPLAGHHFRSISKCALDQFSVIPDLNHLLLDIYVVATAVLARADLLPDDPANPICADSTGDPICTWRISSRGIVSGAGSTTRLPVEVNRVMGVTIPIP